MELKLTYPFNVIVFICFCFFVSSCSKDSDLLADLLLEDSSQNVLVDDVFVVSLGGSTVLDVLANDGFDEQDNVTITGVSQPNNGTVTVNEDNSITYVPESEEENTDAFTYTAEVVNEDASVDIETGNVTVTVTDNPSENIQGVNFSVFGAVGDGVADDTAALQSALDSGKPLIGNPGAKYKISGLLKINKKGDQYIDWNGSSITASEVVSQVFKVDKPTGLLTMSDLTVEGNGMIEVGFWIYTVVKFSNVDVKDLRSTKSASYAFRYEVVADSPNGWGDSSFDGCDCSNIGTQGNGVIGDSSGTTRCLIFRWWHDGPTSKIVWKNSVFDGTWGDDGDLIQIEQRVSNINDSKLIFDNMVFKNFSRRGIKGTGGGVEFRNSLFESPSRQHPNLTGRNLPPAGLVAMGNFIQNEAATGTKFIGCTFDGSKGYDKRVIFNRQDGVEIIDCNFINADIAFTAQLIGDFYLCGNNFDSSSSVYEYGLKTNAPYIGKINIGNDNKGLEGGKNRLPQSRYSFYECSSGN